MRRFAGRLPCVRSGVRHHSHHAAATPVTGAAPIAPDFIGFMKDGDVAPPTKMPCSDLGGSAPDPVTPRMEVVGNEALPMGEAEATQEEMWQKMTQRLKERRVKSETRDETLLRPSIVDYYKAEAVVKEEDRYHWRLGKVLFPDFDMRLQYYALYALLMSLNKAKWVSIDVAQSKSGKLGANMRQAFWVESMNSIIDKGDMPTGEFVNGHPVLRPIAAMHKDHKFTKHYLRAFVSARLKIPFQQPGNMKQLAEYYDKCYSSFYLVMLEMMGVKNNICAEHVASHIGKAVGFTQQSVLLWRHYARKNIVMLPADLCAECGVSYGLVCNIPLATKDSGVRRVLQEIMNTVKHELAAAKELMGDFPAAGWPLLMEAVLPNYYVNFLLKHDFDVTARMSEEFVYTPGFYVYLMRKVLYWSRHHDYRALMDENAPLF